MITPEQVDAAIDCLEGGGLILFGADTVYGLACDAADPEAAARLEALKGRPPGKPSAVLAFSRQAARPLLDPLGPRTRAAADLLFPGPVTVILPGAGGADPVGLRMPVLTPAAAALAAIPMLVLQSSANLSGRPAPSELAAVDPQLRAAAGIELDAGALPGTASSVVDLTRYEIDGSWRLLREGGLTRTQLSAVLGNPADVIGRRPPV